MPSSDLAFLAGGGEMGALMRAHDWAPTPLASLETWPQSLRSAVSIMLNSRYPIALYWGPQLALLYNDAWAPIPGGKHPWALGRPGREVWPEIWDTIGPMYERVFATGEGVWQEDELLPMNRHGYLEECYYNFTFSPVRGEDGRIDGIFNAVVETTDRVLSERRLRTLSRMGERGDPDLSVESACRRAIDSLGENKADVPFALVYLRDEDEARLIAAVGVAPDTIEAPMTIKLNGEQTTWPPLAAANEAGQGLVVDPPPHLNLPHPLWPEPVSQIILVPVIAAGEGRPSAFLVAGANPRRRIDAGYRSFFDLAAGHVATAISTARAYEEERKRAQALAELDQAKTQFFSNVSHEFRTPLTLMLGPLEDALADIDASTPKQRERLDLAHRNALRLLRLVNALLDFSRIEAGRMQASFRPTDLASLTADLASSFRAATDRAGLKLVVNAPPLSSPAYVDPGMWETIVLNLVSNAFKFTQQGEIEVQLREDGGQARLTVRDTGAGIPAAELPKLFDRFHRVEGAQGRSFEGTGIGLALVQELVKLHGGVITVDSEEGVGTLFTVRLPLGADHLPDDRVESRAGTRARTPRAQSFVEEALRWLPGDAQGAPIDAGALDAPPSASASEARPSRAHVLLADDNADLRGYIAGLLAEQSYEVEAVADGDAALAAARARRPDLLITDVMMPGLDGFGLLRQVRTDERLRDLPVVMLSARAGEEAKVEGLDAGADDYLTKPFSARELLARVSANINLARLRREAAEAIRASEQHLRELNATLNQRVADALAEKRVFADIVEATDAALLVVDTEFRFLAVNAAAQRDFERVFGVTPRIGETVQEALAHRPEDRDAAHRLWSRVLAGETFTETGWWGSDANERRAYETRFSPLRDASGRQIGAFVFGQDITERLREQENLAAAEDQLRQARKMEAMGQLTGGVAHDFNNLLTPIVGALDMLQRKGLGGEREQRLIVGAAQSAERAKVLVQRLLAFARRQPLQLVSVDMAKLIIGMSDLIAGATGPQIAVVVDVSDPPPRARADPNQLEMALLNLAVNARDAMPNGGTLRITTARDTVGQGDRDELAPGGYVRLSVEDTGAGMDEATLQRAIEPFFSTKGIGKGTGLGLSMVHGLASQLGGALVIKSRPGLGTNVELWLPEGGEVADAGSAPMETSNRGAHGKVLLVDDEDLVRLSTADMLADLGYEVLEAASAEEALAIVRNGARLHLVVTDHLMPGMTGTEFARSVQTLQPGVPILVISGYAESEGVEPDLPRLTKPFRKDELAASLAALSASSVAETAR